MLNRLSVAWSKIKATFSETFSEGIKMNKGKYDRISLNSPQTSIFLLRQSGISRPIPTLASSLNTRNLRLSVRILGQL
jgi:hypothetical protein